MSFEIVFDHPQFLVVDKPAGYLTVPSRYEKDDNRKVLGRELERVTRARLYPVHRLDFEVSGIVLFAKNPEAQKTLNKIFETRKVEKMYEAWTTTQDFGHWPKDLPRADEDIFLDPSKPLKWECKIMRGKRRSYESPQGDPSITLVQFRERTKEGYLRWMVQPLTGRPHQIRFEMSRHGFPIIGDILYGSKKAWPAGQIALRAISLKIGKIYSDAPEKFEVGGLRP